MHKFHQVLLACSVLSISSQLFAADLQATLKTQIELLPSCVINDQHYDQGAQNIKFGELNFGEVASSYQGVIDTTLSHATHNAIKVKCSGTAQIMVTFGAGQNDSNVPDAVKANYFRALSNGRDFIGYNLLYSANKQVMKPQQKLSLNNDGQAQFIELYGQASLKGPSVSIGTYRDIIPITIEF